MAINPNLPPAMDTPPAAPSQQADTPRSDLELMATDLGAGAPGAVTPPPVVSPVPEVLMRDDYLRKLNELETQKAQLAAERAELEKSKGQGLTADELALAFQKLQQQQQQAAETPAGEEKFNIDTYQAYPWLKEVGGVELPTTWESDGEAALARGMNVVEKLIDGLHQRLVATENALRESQAAQASQQQNTILSTSASMIGEKLGLQVSQDDLIAAWKVHGTGAMAAMGVKQPTPEAVTTAWAIAQSLKPAPVAGIPATTETPAPVQGGLRPATMADLGAESATPRAAPPAMAGTGSARGVPPPMTDEEKMLADMQIAG